MDVLKYLGENFFKLRLVFFPFREHVIGFVFIQGLTFVLPSSLTNL
jgi:hypothetical protein